MSAILGQVNIVSELGSGTFGKVYKVESKNDGKTYALKVVELRNGEISFEDVRREMEFLERLEHPGIVRCVLAFQELEDGMTLAIQMEYCTKGDLQSFINHRKGKKFSSKTMQKWMTQLSSAVLYIHAQNIMHRDLRPENIFLDDHMNVKVGDFGSAKNVLHNFAGTSFGISLFMAPEIYNGCSNMEADIYSLGCVFLCLVNVEPLPKTYSGRIISLPPKITYGVTKNNIIRQCIDDDKSKRPTALEILSILKTDDYETLCFNKVRSAHILSSLNKVVASRKSDSSDPGLVFSNRPVKPGERFCLQIREVRTGTPCEVTFGYLYTDPHMFRKSVPHNWTQLQKQGNVLFCRTNVKPNVGKKFTFWFDQSGVVFCENGGHVLRYPDTVLTFKKIWLCFSIESEILQVQLTDYDQEGSRSSAI